MRDSISEKQLISIVGILRDERKQQGLSYEKLAEKAGVHRTAISLIENSKRSPTVLMCLKLCRALGIDFADVITHSKRSK
jgi:transcriptional regulator with XRE-family HTH domain